MVENEDEWQTIQRKVQIDGSAEGGFAPGGYVFLFLARYTDADSILFSDWASTPDSKYNSRSGRIFVVTAKAIIFVDFENAIDESHGNPTYGTASVQLYGRTAGDIINVRWNHRILYPENVKVEPNTIAVTAPTWSIGLPLRRRDADSEAYFGRLLSALNLQ